MRTPKIIRDAGEKPFVLYSDVRQPLSAMTFLERALAFSELSMIAYNDEAEARRAGDAIGFPHVELLDRDGAQAYVFRNDHDVVVAFRGSQATEWNDIQADARATLAVIGTLGRVHSGFNRELDDIWPLMGDLLAANRLPLYFCGHSLGGGVATLAAYRCRSEAFPNQPVELHTFGSPRVADHRYVGHTMLKHYRWVHNNDIVTREPPRPLAQAQRHPATARSPVWLHEGPGPVADRHARGPQHPPVRAAHPTRGRAGESRRRHPPVT